MIRPEMERACSVGRQGVGAVCGETWDVWDCLSRAKMQTRHPLITAKATNKLDNIYSLLGNQLGARLHSNSLPAELVSYVRGSFISQRKLEVLVVKLITARGGSDREVLLPKIFTFDADDVLYCKKTHLQ